MAVTIEFTPYLLTAVITSLGLLIGAFLAIIAEEELKQSRYYFHLAVQILPALMIVAYFTTYYVYWYWVLVAALIVFIPLRLYKHFQLKHCLIAYPLLGFIFYMSHFFPRNFIINSTLIFLFGLPAGSIIFNPKKKYRDFKKVIIPIILFLAVAIIFYILNLYVFGFYELTS